MLKQKHTIALGALLLLVVVLLNLPGKTTAQLKLALSSFFLPLFRLESAARVGIDKTASAIVPRDVLKRQIDELSDENSTLRVEILRLREVERENGNLRDMLEYSNRGGWSQDQLKPAHVIGQDAVNWWSTLIIDIGREEGLQPDMPVISSKGMLVGKILEVRDGSSLVVLLGDPKCQLSAMLWNSGDSGILKPRGDVFLNPLLVDLSNLSNDAILEKDEWVVTSGKGNVFPPGLPIGRVVDWRSVEFGLYLEATVRLSANFNRLEEVMVLVQ